MVIETKAENNLFTCSICMKVRRKRGGEVGIIVQINWNKDRGCIFFALLYYNNLLGFLTYRSKDSIHFKKGVRNQGLFSLNILTFN